MGRGRDARARRKATGAPPLNVRRSHPGEPPAAGSPAGRRVVWIKLRMAMLLVFLAAGLVLIVSRAWGLQVRDGAELRQMAEQQYLREVRLPGRRGIIYDRNNRELAVSVDVESIFANPREVVDAPRTAAVVAGALGLEEARLARKLSGRRFFVWLKRRVRPEEASAIRALNLRGVYIQRESRRYYPNRDLASHVLGFAGLDAVGLEGVELTQDDRLRGHGEVISGLRDARGNLVFAEELIDGRKVAGNDVVLSIDTTIQHIAEEELAGGMRTYEARAGTVVIVEPATGEVFAIANWPSFNPNDFADASAFARRDRAITDRFEPGSTMKIFTLAAALASGTLRPTELVNCEQGVFELADYVIHDAHRDGWLTPTQVLARSSNIGAAKIALALGRSRLYQFFRRFGFGEMTGVPLPGETPGSIADYRRWRDADTASAAFGQGISMSAFQLAMAVAAVANGGRLMRPLLVRRIVNSRGETVEQYMPEVRRRVIPQTTARLVTDMLTAVTEDGGTGIEGGLDDYVVAGKTGTAQKADFEHGGYSADRWLASFVGFVPADRPRLAMAVIVDEPIVNHYGGLVAAPVFRRIADRVLRYLGVVPSFARPPRRASRGSEAARAAAAEGDSIEAAALGLASPAVDEQDIRPGTAEVVPLEHAGDAEPAAATAEPVEEQADPPPASPEDEVIYYERLPRAEPARLPPLRAGYVRVPDLSGMTLRQALQHVRRKSLRLESEGSGVVVRQVPEPAAQVPRRTPVRVRLETAR